MTRPPHEWTSTEAPSQRQGEPALATALLLTAAAAFIAGFQSAEQLYSGTISIQQERLEATADLIRSRGALRECFVGERLIIDCDSYLDGL